MVIQVIKEDEGTMEQIVNRGGLVESKKKPSNISARLLSLL